MPSGTAAHAGHARRAGLAQALRLCVEGLGWPVSGASSDEVAFLKTSGAVIALYPRHLLAADAFPGFALAHNVASKELVDQVLATAVDACGRLVKPGVDALWGGYSGYFADPEGNLWEVAFNPFMPINADGHIQLP